MTDAGSEDSGVYSVVALTLSQFVPEASCASSSKNREVGAQVLRLEKVPSPLNQRMLKAWLGHYPKQDDVSYLWSGFSIKVCHS